MLDLLSFILSLREASHGEGLVCFTLRGPYITRHGVTTNMSSFCQFIAFIANPKEPFQSNYNKKNNQVSVAKPQ